MSKMKEVGYIVKETNGDGFEYDRGTYATESEARYMAHDCMNARIIKVTLEDGEIKTEYLRSVIAA